MSIVVVDFFGPDLKRVNNTRVLWKIVIKFVYKKHPISGNEWFIAVHNWEIDLCIKPIMLGNWLILHIEECFCEKNCGNFVHRALSREKEAKNRLITRLIYAVSRYHMERSLGSWNHMSLRKLLVVPQKNVCSQLGCFLSFFLSSHSFVHSVLFSWIMNHSGAISENMDQIP